MRVLCGKINMATARIKQGAVKVEIILNMI